MELFGFFTERRIGRDVEIVGRFRQTKFAGHVTNTFDLTLENRKKVSIRDGRPGHGVGNFIL